MSKRKGGKNCEKTNFPFFLFLTVKPYVIKAPEDVSAVAGDEINLACVVGGRPRPEIQWMRENGKFTREN